MSKPRIFETGISSQYVKHWGVIEALREVLQNWYDVQSEFGCGGSQAWTDGKATLVDFGPGLEPRHLALGISEKGAGSIGQFGEGLKLAMLVLVREGREVTVLSNGRKIRPVLYDSLNYETEILAFEVSRALPRKGTVILVECEEDELRQGNEFFEAYLERQPDFEWLEEGKISLYQGHGGLIFVNGSVICYRENAHYNYHIRTTSPDLVNRDRSAVDVSKIRLAVGSLFDTLEKIEVISKILKAVTDLASFETNVTSYPVHDRYGTWKVAWLKTFGKLARVATGTKYDNLAGYYGYKVVDLGYYWNSFAERQLGVDNIEVALQKAFQEKQVVPLNELTAVEGRNLNIAVDLVGAAFDIVYEDEQIQVAEKLFTKDSKAEADGCYEPKTRKIWLVREVLSDLYEAVRTLAHETAHITSGAADLSGQFEWELTKILGKVLVDSWEVESD